jgi:hypothetical protein
MPRWNGLVSENGRSFHFVSVFTLHATRCQLDTGTSPWGPLPVDAPPDAARVPVNTVFRRIGLIFPREAEGDNPDLAMIWLNWLWF